MKYFFYLFFMIPFLFSSCSNEEQKNEKPNIPKIQEPRCTYQQDGTAHRTKIGANKAQADTSQEQDARSQTHSTRSKIQDTLPRMQDAESKPQQTRSKNQRAQAGLQDLEYKP